MSESQFSHQAASGGQRDDSSIHLTHAFSSQIRAVYIRWSSGTYLSKSMLLDNAPDDRLRASF